MDFFFFTEKKKLRKDYEMKQASLVFFHFILITIVCETSIIIKGSRVYVF